MESSIEMENVNLNQLVSILNKEFDRYFVSRPQFTKFDCIYPLFNKKNKRKQILAFLSGFRIFIEETKNSFLTRARDAVLQLSDNQEQAESSGRYGPPANKA